jgi:hypothetical protein
MPTGSVNGEHPSTETPNRRVQQTCLQHPGAVLVSPVKAMSVRHMKRQEAQSRMAALRKARRSPATAAALQHRASLVGGGAKWRITNLNQVARAIAQWR